MKISISEALIKNEILPLLKVFYPLEVMEDAAEQSDYRIHMDEFEIMVAHFSPEGEHSIRKSIEDLKGLESLSGKARKSFIRTELKRMLYTLCSEVTGKIPEWGILTGIRPTKLAFKLYRASGDLRKVKKTLIQKYRLSETKAALLLQVIQHEGPYMKPIGSGTSIYIGVPFCPSRCSYCTFASYQPEKWVGAYEAYTEALIQEMRPFRDAFERCESVYIGGGTPTALTEPDFRKLVLQVRQWLGDRRIEFTVEAGRPDAITVGKLNAMKQAGVTRISINPQTMEDRTLERVGRKHTSKDIIDCFQSARALGFNDINMDMIIGLPGESSDDVKRTLNVLTDLNPENITVHTLALKRGSRLSDQASEGLLKIAEDIEASLTASSEAMTAAGYQPYYLYRQKNMVGSYENIGYTKPGHASYYNMAIMEETDHILAFGAGAVSKKLTSRGIERMDHPKDVKTYLEKTSVIIERKKAFFSEVV